MEEQIEQWVLASGMKLGKTNERPWGSYELTMSWDGSGFVIPGDTYGSGFTLPHAAAKSLIRILTNPPIDARLRDWLGETRLQELDKLLANKEQELKDALSVISVEN